MQDAGDPYNIVLIDDSFEIRYVVRSLLAQVASNILVHVYTSADGVEGLGYVFATKPDIVIIDTTLPKYSGRELVDFLATNPIFQREDAQAVVLHEDSAPPSVPSQFLLIRKSDPDFVEQFQGVLSMLMGVESRGRSSWRTGFRNKLAKLVIKSTNSRDALHLPQQQGWKKVTSFFRWIGNELIVNIVLPMFSIISGGVPDDNQIQAAADLRRFRVRHYPTFAAIVSTIVVLLLQFVLFVTGGLIIFNTRIESIFALGESQYTLEFNAQTASQYEYDEAEIEFGDESVALRVQSTEYGGQEETGDGSQESGTGEEEPGIFSEPTSTPDTILPTLDTELDPNSQNLAPSTQESDPSPEPASYPEVLGETTDDGLQTIDRSSESTVQSLTPNTQYLAPSSQITTREPIDYTSLLSISEINLSSGPQTTDDGQQSDDSQSSELVPGPRISYQLSPDSVQWYYWSSEGIWEATTQGAVSSNYIQEVNEHLAEYEDSIGGGSLYLRIYLHSYNQESPILERLIIDRELNLVTSTEVGSTEFESESETITGALDLQTLKPVIFNAAYFQGNKVVKGKLLPNCQTATKNCELKTINYELTAEQLAEYEVSVYFSNPGGATKNELIGTTELYINSRGELEFFLRTPSSPGGYVTAEVEGKRQKSNLAEPVENATFTVDSTGDGADTGIDGSCDSGSGCTLRAAIAEANANGSDDNIYFNIPTSDTGYRDYDDPDTASSGDSLGGDDYWTIKPATTYPNILEATTVNGATQEGLSGFDRNTIGPDIEINGSNLPDPGVAEYILDFRSTSDGSGVNSLTINNYLYGGSVRLDQSDDFALTSSFIGVDALGLDYGPNELGIRVMTSTNVDIGHDTTDGNVIGGTHYTGLYLTCGTTGVPQVVTVRGNKFGTSVDGQNLIPNGYMYGGNADIAIWSGQCAAEVGGDQSTHRNYFVKSNPNAVSNPYAIFISVSDDALNNVGVYNNFFGTNIDGSQKIGTIPATVSIYDSGSNYVQIGDTGKGNLFRYGYVTFNSSAAFGTYTPRAHVKANTFSQEYTRSFSLINAGSMIIEDNFFGQSAADPYFGVELPATASSPNYRAIDVLNVTAGLSLDVQVLNNTFNECAVGLSVAHYSTTDDISTTVKGNLFQGGNIAVERVTNFIALNRTATFSYHSMEIGGANNLAGSKCNGTEQNCFVDQEYAGILWWEDPFENYATIFTDNVFQHSNPSTGYKAIIHGLHGMFEIFSGDVRRTDLTSGTINLPVDNFFSITPSGVVSPVTTFADYTYTCVDAATCPATGDTSGVAGQTKVFATILMEILGGYYDYSWPLTYDYYYDLAGNLVEPTLIQFDTPHVASEAFSFDAVSSTDEINYGAGYHKVSDGKDYYDRGEPWTNNPPPAGTGAFATKDYGYYQIMEVELVDANPILQDDGSYVITVDSTTDEDNVSLSGYDCGTGTAYECGGTEGVDGLSNGKTSLREAIIAANNHPGLDYIHFNIPLTDSSYDTEYPGAFLIEIDDNLSITGPTVVDATTQASFSGDTNAAVSEPAAQPVIGTATTGPEIMIRNTTISRVFYINAAGSAVQVSGFGFQNTALTNHRQVQVNEAASVLLDHNDFIDSSFGAVIMGFGATANSITVRDNVFRDVADQPAIESWGADNPLFLVDNNQFINSTTVYSLGQNVVGQTIFSNNLFKTTRLGINSPNPHTITGNTFSDHQIVINALRQTDANTIQDNLFVDLRDSLIPIDLSLENWGADGRTENDAGDTDTGPNDLQNFPVITAVDYLGLSQYRISGDLDGNAAEAPFDIEVCLSETTASGYSACTQIVATTNANSPWTTTITLPGDNGTEGRVFTALATNTGGSTSEFSDAVTAQILEYSVPLIYPIGGIRIATTQPIFDWSPAQKNGLVNPEVDHYELFVDGSFVASIPASQTYYQIPSELELGAHTWQVVAYRSAGEETGRSGEESFVIVEQQYELELIYPVDIAIDTRFPLFDWTDLLADLEVTTTVSYQLYLDDELLTTVTESEFESEIGLEYGDHTWYVIAINADTEEVLYTSNTASFTILSDVAVDQPISLPVAQNPTAISQNLAVTLPVLAGTVVTVGTLLTVATATGATILEAGRQLAGMLLGMIIVRKKKYWGIVYDHQTHRSIPFAQVSLVQNDKVVESTVTDLHGRYGFQVTGNGQYLLLAKSSGYQDYSRTITPDQNSEIIEDVALNAWGVSDNWVDKYVRRNKLAVLRVVQIVLAVLMMLGFVYTAYAYSVSPNALNLTMLVLYLAVFSLNVFVLIRWWVWKDAGVIVDSQTNKPIPAASVRFYEDKRQVAVLITNEGGRIKANLRSGQYWLLVYKQGYKKLGTGVTVNKAGHIGKPIKLDQANKAEPHEMRMNLDNPFQ